MITGEEIKSKFYINNKCVKEKVIEETFNSLICQIYPDTKIEKTFGLHKTKIHTDGIIEFNTGKWLLQECKRDIGIKSVQVPRAFLQAMCYMSKYFDDVTPVRVQDFKGIILDSAQFICYIPCEEIIKIMSEFILLYNKYWEVRPSETYIIPEMNKWAISNLSMLNKYIFKLDTQFRFDLFIKDLYENKI